MVNLSLVGTRGRCLFDDKQVRKRHLKRVPRQTRIDACLCVSARKLGFFVQIKEDDNFNYRNTLSISRIKI